MSLINISSLSCIKHYKANSINTKLSNLLLYSYKQSIIKTNKKEIEQSRRYCRNIIHCKRHVTLREDKSLYIGWSRNENDEDVELMDPQIFCIIDIESCDLIKIHSILENPYANITTDDIALFKKDFFDLSKENNIYIDYNKLKKYDNGRWYLNLFYNI